MMKPHRCLVIWALSGGFCCFGWAGEPFALKRCQLVPLPEHQVSFQIDGVEKTRWHFGTRYPRPFFYPLSGPSGAPLTRMGHPGAQNHDHHRSVWFAHHDVNGVDFWSDRTDARVRQKLWYCYRDGDEEAVMASVSGWYDGRGKELMEQDVVAALRPLQRGEHALEIQITMRPAAGAESVELGKTNFGFLAVRVAKTLSVHFGGGSLTDSEGRQGEPAIFGKSARWMDYSGPVGVGRGTERKAVVEASLTSTTRRTRDIRPPGTCARTAGWERRSACTRAARLRRTPPSRCDTSSTPTAGRTITPGHNPFTSGFRRGRGSGSAGRRSRTANSKSSGRRRRRRANRRPGKGGSPVFAVRELRESPRASSVFNCTLNRGRVS